MLTASFLVIAASLSAEPLPLHIAADGSDAHDGSASAPFATIPRAMEAVRAITAQGLDRPIVVDIAPGRYELQAPLHFSTADGGTSAHAVTYRGDAASPPVITGHRRITNWQRVDGDRWQALLPAALQGAPGFRQLFRDGVRLTRGRWPNEGELLRVTAVSDDVRHITLDAPPPLDAAPAGLELVMYQNWSISRDRVTAVDGAAVTTANPLGWIGHGAYTTASEGKPCYLENAAAFVDVPGEWHVDAAGGTVLYHAAPGENPNDHTFEAPALEQWLILAGAPDAPVRNLHFEHLVFSGAEWPLPPFGYMGIQAGHHGTAIDAPTRVLPGAIEMRDAEACSFRACRITQTGASGLVMGAGCRSNRVAHSVFSDIGGNGIMIGWRGNPPPDAEVRTSPDDPDWSLARDWPDNSQVPRNNEVSDSLIERCGQVNHGCVGVFAAFTEGTRILHNHIRDLPYTGISVGFRWNPSPTSQRDALVAFNHIHDVMQMLADGGGIYTLGLQPGTILRGNHIHGVPRSAYAHGGAPNNGIFFDEGTTGVRVEDTLIYGTSGEPIRFNQTSSDRLTWHGNHFGVEPAAGGAPDRIAAQAGPRSNAP